MSDRGIVERALTREHAVGSGVVRLAGLGLRTVPDDLPAMLARLDERVVVLDLSRNRIRELPPSLWELTGLAELDLAHNRLSALPEQVGRLVELRRLDVSFNRLTTLPDLSRCAALESVDVSGNLLGDLDGVMDLHGLVELNAAGNALRQLPRLPSPRSLAVVNLAANELVALPDNLLHLPSLTWFDVSGNRLGPEATERLADLPPEVVFAEDNPGSAAQGLEPYVRTVGGERGKLYFNGPSYVTDLVLPVLEPADVGRVVDLHRTRFARVPAALEVPGLTVELDGLSRSVAERLVTEHRDAGMRVVVAQSHGEAEAQTGAEFLRQAQRRTDRSPLVTAAGDVVVPPTGRRYPFEWSTTEQVTAALDPDLIPEEPADADERVVNVEVDDGAGNPVLTRNLAPASPYTVRIDIDVPSDRSVVVAPMAVRVEDLHDPVPDGYWLDVVVVSSDVEVEPRVHRLFLPRVGASWVCSCQGDEHECSAQDRRPWLEVPFRTTTAVDAATLRCTVYSANHTVQSVRVEFGVGPGGGPGAIRGIVDYALTDDLGHADDLPARRLNILTNDGPTGTHSIVVNAGDRAVAVSMRDDAARASLTAIRTALADITLTTNRTDSAYDASNARPVADLIQDLDTLARLGWQLYAASVPASADRRYLRDALATRSTIQVTRVTETMFPWSVVYDIPHTTGAAFTPCPLLREWSTSAAVLADYPAQCPFAADHGLDVLCPYGFWGFHHLIEQPASVHTGTLRTDIPVAGGARAMTSVSLVLDERLASTHLTDLASALAGTFTLDACNSHQDVATAFAAPELPLAYFYCHGLHKSTAGLLPIPVLQIGKADIIGSSDFSAWDSTWPQAHWSQVAPLVFINGCETAALSPEDVGSFVEALAGVEAAGVIGTEIAVAQVVAGEVATRFFTRFAGPGRDAVGMAMHRARIDLLAKGNVGGLVYTSFCSADLRLSVAEPH